MSARSPTVGTNVRCRDALPFVASPMADMISCLLERAAWLQSKRLDNHEQLLVPTVGTGLVLLVEGSLLYFKPEFRYTGSSPQLAWTVSRLEDG